MKSLHNLLHKGKSLHKGCYEIPNDNVQRQFVYFIVAICRNTLKKSFLS